MIETKKLIITLLNSITRGGSYEFVTWLEGTDFFEAPCSTMFHLNRSGGLAEHSLNVYELLKEKVERYGLDISPESVIICGLGHDLCKINMYDIDEEPITDAQAFRLKKEAGANLYAGLVKQGLTKAWASVLIDHYIKQNKENNGEARPEKVTSYKVNDQFPMGHGEKSVSILQDFIRLTEEEKLAIRWHMVAFDAGIHFNYPSGFAFNQAVNKYPLVTLLFTADFEASNIIER